MKHFNTFSAKGSTFVRLHEGFVPRWYLDPVGVPTIGIGFTWRSASFKLWWAANKSDMAFKRGATMTRAEADDALQFLVNNEYGKAVDVFLGKEVAQHVFDGMVSPVYNLGPVALEWKWAAKIKSGEVGKGANMLRTTGTTANGVRLAGLVRRRGEECILIRDGIYTGVDTPHTATGDALADGVLQRGERGIEVAKLIEDLHRLGLYDGTLDDVFGHGTEAAVLEYQRANGLTPDGKAGPATLAHIAGPVKPVGFLAMLLKLIEGLFK